MTKTNDTKLTIPHLPEPWTYNFARPYGIVDIIASDPTGEYTRGLYVAQIDTDDVGRFTSHEQHEANARRIVAAVNACKGFDTEALERNAVHALLEAAVVAWRRSANHEKLTLQECNQLCAAIVAATRRTA
jgi:hypothetical protein